MPALADVVSELEGHYDPAWAEPWDAVGLVCGDPGAEVRRALFAVDPVDHRATPLEIVRSLRREPTQLLARSGVPPVPRDQYETRSFPDDVYGIVPRSLADLGDEELGHQMLAWGIGKTTVLRARSALPGDRG